MKRFLCAFFAILICISLYSCKIDQKDEKENNLMLEVSPYYNVHSLVSIEYTQDQIKDICAFEGNVDEYRELYKIECLRYSANSASYRAVYLGESCVAMIIFDEAGNKQLAKCFSSTLTKDDFSSVFVGDTLGKVKDIDPDGFFPFLETGKNDYVRTSTHCTSDGYLITASYDGNNTIISLSIEFI